VPAVTATDVKLWGYVRWCRKYFGVGVVWRFWYFLVLSVV